MKHVFTGLIFAPQTNEGVLAVCSCGWHGPTRRPEEHGGDTSVWIADFDAHEAESHRNTQGES